MLRFIETDNLTDEQVALKENIHKFCQEVLRPASIELDKLHDPEDVIKKAVWGMVPKNKLGRAVYKKLKVYRGPDHPHSAQSPQVYEF